MRAPSFRKGHDAGGLFPNGTVFTFDRPAVHILSPKHQLQKKRPPFSGLRLMEITRPAQGLPEWPQTQSGPARLAISVVS
jgi:hypothetical protein